jgi:hypothetical protein
VSTLSPKTLIQVIYIKVLNFFAVSHYLPIPNGEVAPLRCVVSKKSEKLSPVGTQTQGGSLISSLQRMAIEVIRAYTALG